MVKFGHHSALWTKGDIRRGLNAVVAEGHGMAELKLRGPASLRNQWWYYTVELAPGMMARGQYPDDFPLLPRMMLRRIGLANRRCLDLGTMEGLMPVLMCRGGASDVLAADFNRFCMPKIRAVRATYGVNFRFQSVGPMDGLYRKVSGGFDLINCSGLLYHVWSPLHVLAGVRPLLYRGGLMIVSTHVVLHDGMYAEFNAAGRVEQESNTFWYPTLELLEYQLQYLRLEPVSALLLPMPHEGLQLRGYVSVLCRATDRAARDPWMARSAAESWEYQGFSDWSRADSQPRSTVGDSFQQMSLGDPDRLDRVPVNCSSQDGNVLHLSDMC